MKQILSFCIFMSVLVIILTLFLLPACTTNPDIDKQITSLQKTKNPEIKRQVSSLRRKHTDNVKKQISSLKREENPNFKDQTSLLKRKNYPDIENQLSLLQKHKPSVNNEISCLFECEIKESKLKDLKELINKMILKVEDNEPGTIEYEFFFNTEETRLFIFQRYKDNQSAMIHMEGFKQFSEEVMSMVELKNLTVFGPAKDDLKNIFQGLQVTYQDLYLKK